MWGLGTTSSFRWYSSDYRRSFQLNSPVDKMTTGEQSFFCLQTKSDPLWVNNNRLAALCWSGAHEHVVGLGVEG